MREFDLLEHVFAANPGLPATVVIPPGDDMGMVRVGGCDLLAGVDQVVGGIHFDPVSTSPELIGRKAVNRSLSDIAAMATVPVAALATAVLPPGFGAAAATVLFDGMRKAGDTAGCPLIGGDVSIHTAGDAPLVCTITVLSRWIDEAHPPVRRDGAMPGDGVFVTGVLGGSLRPDAGGHHLTFQPRIKEAIELSQALSGQLHAMIDISDGLGRDAGHIASQSGVAILLEADRIPCAKGCSWKDGLGDGEDYELLFTASADVPSMICGVPITQVGTITSDKTTPGVTLILPDGDCINVGEQGWQHQA